ncbi:MAG: 3-oxoacyl-[acyl-carrier-protein] reductase [Butyricicoccus sp.]|nr:3-oxoacyl-[acyl-carrier-protein] reductase [Butyricicoccus sp.]
MLKGKTAVVTGGSRGIGAAICEKLAYLGADVAVIYAGNEAAAQAVCDKCAAEHGVRALAYRCDVSDFEASKETVARIKADFGGVDILVNNAGINRDGLIARMKESDFDDVVNTNLKGAFNMIRHCSGLFIRARAGKIINISSVAGIMGNAGQANYAASKAGLIGLTKSVARELAGRGVTCNAIAPGFIATDMTAGFDENNALVASIPLGRMGTPGDVAELAAFLAGSGSDYITGEVFRVDGGIAM